MKQILALVAMAGALYATALPPHLDPDVVSVNRRAARSSFAAYPDTIFSKSNIMSLNGLWDFRYADDGRDLNKAKWTTIRVPGNMEVQGFGHPIYVNQEYDFAPVNPAPPTLPDRIPAGEYRRTFTLPAEAAGKQVLLRLNGAGAGVYTSVNGHSVGYSEDTKNPAEFDITPFLKEGENEVSIVVYRWSTGSYLECQDFWRLSGIERDVDLIFQNPVHVADFAVRSTLDDTYTNGDFGLTVQVENESKADTEAMVRYTLKAADGSVAASGSSMVSLSPGITTVPFTATIPGVEKWTAETPHLYDLTIALEAPGQPASYIPFRPGFRRVEIKALPSDRADGKPWNLLTVNGVPVTMRGVNLHEHDPKTGHYVTEETIKQDLMLMKGANMNAIRTCHYPQQVRFYELCDSLGFYVYDEANIESHGMGYDLNKGHTLGNNPDWLKAHMDRTQNLFLRNKNYPSVVIWSLGNEAGNGYNFYETYLWMKDAEKALNDRPVAYERAIWEWNTDMFVPQYPSAGRLEEWAKSGPDRPVIPSEYAHMMGNSGGNLALQWKVINAYPELQGGFIWDWVDQGLEETDSNGNVYYTFGGDYGEGLPSSGNFNCNGVVNPDRKPHPAYAEIKYAYSPVGIEAVDAANGKFRALNRHDFRNLGDFDIYYTIKNEGKAIATGKVNVDAAPHGSADFSVPVRVPAVGETFINFSVRNRASESLRPAGTEIFAEQIALGGSPAPLKYSTKGKALSLTDSDSRITIDNPTVHFAIDKSSGQVVDYTVKGVNYVAEGFGPVNNFWRAPNDNDLGNDNPVKQLMWKQAETNPCTVTAEKSGDNVLVKVVRTMPLEGTYTLLYDVMPSGVIRVTGNYSGGHNDQLDIPRLGWRMRMPQQFDRVSYFGKGPGENYEDRQDGSFVDLYTTTVDQMYYPYVRPQENGHRIGVRRLSLTDRRGHGLEIVGDATFEFNALPMSREDLEGGRQSHMNDVTRRPYTELSIDYRQQGVGGYDSWGSRTEPTALIPANTPATFTVTLIPR